jgi:hypothetical protein
MAPGILELALWLREASNGGMRRPLVVLLAIALSGPGLFAAGQQASETKDPPVSLARIKRELNRPRQVESLNELRLAYYVSVSADAPQVNIFKDFDWKHGTVPGSAPSHQELFQQVTPKEFSAPVADFTAIAAWLGSRMIHRKPSP